MMVFKEKLSREVPKIYFTSFGRQWDARSGAILAFQRVASI
jgi:hypothetical protein